MTKITAPGVYDGVPFASYLGDTCDAPSISGSGLTLIERACPAIYYVTSPYNPDRIVEEDTPALRFGRAFHCFVLEGEAEFRKRYRVKPEGHDGRTKEGKAWLAENDVAGVDFLSADQWKALVAMRDAVMRHPRASKAFTDGRPEQSMFAKDPATGVWLKARPDWLGNSSRFIPNLKSTMCAKAEVFEVDAHRRGYHQSAALCQDIARAVGIEDPVPYLVIQEKDPPYLVDIATFEDEALEWGRILNRKAIDTFARCIETGEWPGYADNVITIRMPRWMEHRLMERSAAGEFVAPPDPEYTDVRNILSGA
jgi:hypothetical protein